MITPAELQLAIFDALDADFKDGGGYDRADGSYPIPARTYTIVSGAIKAACDAKGMGTNGWAMQTQVENE